MSDKQLEIDRQEMKDQAYLRACLEHGLEPMFDRYRTPTLQPLSDQHEGPDTGDGFLESVRRHSGDDPLDPAFHYHEAEEPDPERPRIDPEIRLALGRLIAWLLGTSKGCRDACVTRMWSLAWILDIDGTGELTLAEVGKKIGVSRAALSASAKSCSAHFGIPCRRLRGAAAGTAYSEARRRAIAEGRGDLHAIHRQREAEKAEAVAV